jgi:hypothetical protein
MPAHIGYMSMACDRPHRHEQWLCTTRGKSVRFDGQRQRLNVGEFLHHEYDVGPAPLTWAEDQSLGQGFPGGAPRPNTLQGAGRGREAGGGWSWGRRRRQAEGIRAEFGHLRQDRRGDGRRLKSMGCERRGPRVNGAQAYRRV